MTAKYTAAKSVSRPDEWLHNGKAIRLGPGCQTNRERPHLPGPHSFTFYRSKAERTTANRHILADRRKKILHN